MEKNNDRKLPLKSLQPKITARSSKPLAFLKLELTPSLFSYSLCENAMYKSQSYLRRIFLLVDEGIFNCCLYLTMTRREQCSSSSSSFFRI